MSGIEFSRLMANLLIGGIVVMSQVAVGAFFMFLLTRIVKGLFSRDEFVFSNKDGQVVPLQEKRKLFSQKSLRKIKKTPMAVSVRKKKSPDVDWEPTLSPEEEKNLLIPTFLRRKKFAHGVASIPTAPQAENQSKSVPTAACVSGEDLFEKKDIFILDPVAE